jgi:hypothetical protein
MRGSKRFTNPDWVVLFPLAVLLVGLAPILWSLAFLALTVVVLVPGMLMVLLWPSLIPLWPSKERARGLWRSLSPRGWPCQSWLRWPWACWKWLSVAGGNKKCEGKTGPWRHAGPI